MSKSRIMKLPVLLLSIWLCFCSAGEMDRRLYGVWRTRHPDYLTSYIEITAEKIVFGNDMEVTQVGTITGIKYKKMPDKIWTQCTLKYRGEDSLDFELKFLFNTRDVGTLAFKNQENLVWKKGYDKTGPAFEPEPIDPKKVPGLRTKK